MSPNIPIQPDQHLTLVNPKGSFVPAALLGILFGLSFLSCHQSHRCTDNNKLVTLTDYKKLIGDWQVSDQWMIVGSAFPGNTFYTSPVYFQAANKLTLHNFSNNGNDCALLITIDSTTNCLTVTGRNSLTGYGEILSDTAMQIHYEFRKRGDRTYGTLNCHQMNKLWK